MGPDTGPARAEVSPPRTLVVAGTVLSTVTHDDAAYGAVHRTQLLDDVRSQVPVVTRTWVHADAHGVHFQFLLRPELRRDQPFYGPRTPGGWQFQLFLNADSDPRTGYSGGGFEFLTRDSDEHIQPGTLDLRRTLGGGGPGGWGDLVASIPASIEPGGIRFTVPLDAIDDDGILDFKLEMYATVLGGSDGETPVAIHVRHYTGTSRLTPSSEDESLAADQVTPSR